MKASLKFRDEQKKPLLRAKVPLNILSFPFQSGVVAGHSEELSLQLCTFFDSGPSVKLAYKPNDASNPFALLVKIGTGKYGSPIDSSMVMSAEFNLAAHGGNPSFFVHFKPRFGDFAIWKKQSSIFAEHKEEDISIEVIDHPKMNRGHMPENFDFPGMNEIKSLPSASTLADRLLTGVEINAATSLPVLNLANLKFQWGLRFPTDVKNMFSKTDGLVINRPPAVSFLNIPFLVMNKISIEHASSGKAKKISQGNSVIPPGAGKDDVSMMCLAVRHQLEALHNENGMLRKAVEDVRSEISCGKMNPLAGEIKHWEVSNGKECRIEGRFVDHDNEEGKKH